MLQAKFKGVGWHPLAARWLLGNLLITFLRSWQDCKGCSVTVMKWGAKREDRPFSLQDGKYRTVGSHFASGWFTHSRNKDTAQGVSLTLTHKGKKRKHKSSGHLDSRPSATIPAPPASRAARLRPQHGARASPPAQHRCSAIAALIALALLLITVVFCEQQREDTTCSSCQPGLTFLESF